MKNLAFILAATALTTGVCLAQLIALSPQSSGAEPQFVNLRRILPETQPKLPGIPPYSTQLLGPTPVSPQQRQQFTTNLSTAATTIVGKLNFQWLGPSRPADWRENRELIEGLSPQSWTRAIGWRPGQSVFPDNESYSMEMESTTDRLLP
jgi:hypothetical protein